MVQRLALASLLAMILLSTGCGTSSNPPVTIDTSTAPQMPSPAGPAQNRVEIAKPGK